MSYDYVWRLCQKEKQSNQLLQISRNFYPEIADYLANAKITEPQKLNLEKLLVGLFEKRKQKLFLYVAYRKPLPQPISDLEQEFYNKIMEIAEKHRLNLSTAANKSNKLLRSVTDIPEIILPSGRKFGPYRKDEIIEIPGSEMDSEYLIKNAICESYNR